MGRDRSVTPLVSMDRRKTDDLDPSRVSDLTLMRTDVANCDECEKERMIEGNSNRCIYIYICIFFFILYGFAFFFFDHVSGKQVGSRLFPLFFEISVRIC